MNLVIGPGRTVLAMLWIAACTGGAGAKGGLDASPLGDVNSAPDAADASPMADETGRPDGGSPPRGDRTPGEAEICDGSNQVRLAVQITGGGQTSAGTSMMAENGWRFLLVDGSCHAWLLRSHNEPLREMTLSPAQEATLLAALQLSNWEPFAPAYWGGCPDAPSINYRFGAQGIQGPTCGLPATHPLRNLNEMFAAQLESLSAVASPVAGDLRYMLVVERSSGIDSRPAASWPLSIPIESVAIPSGEELLHRPGNSRLATGGDADRLRAIRTTNANGGTGTGSIYDFTRVLGPDGTIYQLFVRDAMPGEQANGLLPSAAF